MRRPLDWSDPTEAATAKCCRRFPEETATRHFQLPENGVKWVKAMPEADDLTLTFKPDDTAG